MGKYENLPQWSKDLTDKLTLKLQSLEEYEEQSLDATYYDFYHFLDGCQTVYSLSSYDMSTYANSELNFRKYVGAAGVVDRCLTDGIRKKELAKGDVPLIPILEYKLVPTGHIEWYDATLSADARRNRRYFRGDRGAAELERRRVAKREQQKNNKNKEV